jgi:hypothetical protein
MKKYKINLIKQKHTYKTSELCLLLKVHKATVLNWKKRGLAFIGVYAREFLFLGRDVKSFLKKQSLKYKTILKDDEFYCVRCHKGVVPITGTIAEIQRNKMGKHKIGIEYRSKCPRCQITICRFGCKPNFECIGQNEAYLKKQKGLHDLPLFKVG